MLVNIDGTYTYTLLDNVLLGQEIQGEQTDILATVAITGQDADGDEGPPVYVDLFVTDDVPVIGIPTSVSVDEEGLEGGNAGDSYESGDLPGEAVTASGNLGVSFGADGPAAAGSGFALSAAGAAWDAASMTLTGADNAWTIVVDPSVEGGEYTFTLNQALTHTEADTEDDNTINVSFTATDADGDAQNGGFTVTVDDDGPTAGAVTAATLDDEGLEGGIPEGPGDVAGELFTTSGVLPHSFGADGAGDIDFASMDGDTATVGTETVTYGWDAGTDTLTATITGGDRDGTDLFQVEVTDPSTGAYTVTLLDNVLHDPPELLDPQQISVNTGNTDLGSGMAAGDMVKVTVAVPEDPDAALNFNSNESGDGTAFGITSDVDGSASYSNEINYLGQDGNSSDTTSEVMTFELQNGAGEAADGMIATTATVDINVFYSTESGVGNEVGAYELYNNGNLVQAATTFTADSTGGDFQLVITGPEGGFDEIRFSARTGSDDTSGDDSSDYNVKQITFDLGTPEAPYENDAEVQLTYTVTDADGDAVDGTFGITFDDDMPVAQDVSSEETSSFETDTNLIITLDVSGSMGDQSGVDGLTRLELAKTSINELFEQYEALGDVSVKLIAFNGSAWEAGSDDDRWLSIDEAKAALMSLNAGGGTDYKDAVAAVESAYADPGTIPGAQSVSYFISDGKPSSGQGIDSSDEAAWESFLDSNDIRSYAMGMGENVDEDDLNPLAYDGASGSEIPAVVVTDLSQLSTILANTAYALPLSGYLGSGTSAEFGADGGHVQSIIVDGVTYFYEEGNPVQTIDIGSGGTIELDFDTGEYTYTPPAIITGAISEDFDYTLIDNDGDTDGATLHIGIDPGNGPLVVRDDNVIARYSSNGTVEIPDWALLANDTPPDGVDQAITGIDSSDGADSVTLSPDSVSFDDDGTSGGSFVYTNSAGSQSDTGNVTVTRDGSGGINGTWQDEILIDNNSGHTLSGNEGNDILIGNGGNDDLFGGHGDDILAGGAGSDWLNGQGGDDILAGGTEDDVLFGGQGNDYLAGGAGNDWLDGQGGNDTASYADAGSSVNVDLDNGGWQNTGGSGWDHLNSIENLTGSDYDDTLSGNNGANVLDGGAGDDTLTGDGGADTFRAGEGHDTIMDYDQAEGDLVDFTHIAGLDHYGVRADGDDAELVLYDDTNTELGSVTFDDIGYGDLTVGDELDSLLGQVDVDPEDPTT